MTKSTDGKKMDIKKETIEPAVQAFNNASTTHEGIVAAFENEPKIANMLHSELHDALIILIDTQYDPASPLLDSAILRIPHFNVLLTELERAGQVT